jgi:hypothetical protein
MRILALLALCLCAALPAAARDCRVEMPSGLPRHPFAFVDVLECLLDEIAALKRERARLTGRVAELEATLATIPADYVNADGRIEAAADRPVARARFVLTARTTGGSAALALDPAVLEALCARPGGCAIALAERVLDLGRPEAEAAEGVGPCLFLYDPGDGAWFRAAGCGAGEAVRGVDGNGGPMGDGGAEIVASAGQVCLLADAEARTGPGSALLARDYSDGLFLIAAPGLGADPARRFRCELQIE